MKSFLKFIGVLQEVSNKNRQKRLGKGYDTAWRFNPYNPLSYITILIMFSIFLILYGIKGVWREISINPFKWN